MTKTINKSIEALGFLGNTTLAGLLAITTTYFLHTL